jgi:hypothetical protein
VRRYRPQFGINLIIKLVQPIGVAIGRIPQKHRQVTHMIAG